MRIGALHFARFIEIVDRQGAVDGCQNLPFLTLFIVLPGDQLSRTFIEDADDLGSIFADGIDFKVLVGDLLHVRKVDVIVDDNDTAIKNII